MALTIQAQRGTQDVVPSQSYKWQFLEHITREIALLHGLKELRSPTFEATELFCRSVGDTTDVVQKEMYTFLDKGARSITLKPEGTAGAVRNVLENGLLNDALPVKIFYQTPCFRYEKPDAGRLREFHQFGIEAFGSSSPSADAEVICVAYDVFDTLGVEELFLEINSIGCPECRPKFYQALKDYFEKYKDKLCDTCLTRLDKNPMRILDCKSEICSEIAKDAPIVLDFLCDECKEHFEGVKKRLDAMNIPYAVNPTIVRGLDYYTKTVFEFVTNKKGSQGTICGGGRYDGLLELMGGKPTPALGFGMGFERLLGVLENQGFEFPKPRNCELFIGSIGDSASIKALELTHALRCEGFYVECDTMGRSVKAQMKYADKIGARLSMIIGDSELETSSAEVKDMESGESKKVCFGNGELQEYLYSIGLEAVTKDLEGKFATDLSNNI
ncbi:MAG: histidine--tRNA ligase [Oscillospiraceae bacterium]|nr:histidine--tRNA ligase [Oscillospiraceae bacterium]